MNPEKIKTRETKESPHQLIAQEESILKKFQGKAKKIARVLMLVTALVAAGPDIRDISRIYLPQSEKLQETITETEETSSEEEEAKKMDQYYIKMVQENPYIAVEKEPWAALGYGNYYLPSLKPEERLKIIESAAEKDPRAALQYADCYFPHLKREEGLKIIELAAEKRPGEALSLLTPSYGIFYFFKSLNPKERLKIIESVAEKYPSLTLQYADEKKFQKLLEKSKKQTSKILMEIVNSPYPEDDKIKIACLLNEIVNQKMTIATASKIVNDKEKFLETLLNIKRQPNHLGEISVLNKIKELVLRKIENINNLHDQPDEIRFKSVENLNSQQLYTLMVYGEEEIFTSSFNGLFNRLLIKMKKEGIDGIQLLEKNDFDQFRTFLKMCTNFNRLNEFLKTTEPNQQKSLLEKFVKNIEKEKDSLAQAIAVADTFSLLEDPKILKILQEIIKNEYQRVQQENNKEGMTLYGLLAGMFSEKTVINEEWIKEMAKKYQLPNLIEISLEDLFNQEGVNFQHYFFYNDDDGVQSYENFLSQYKNKPNWEIEDKGEYICIKSTVRNRKIEIYANKPAYENEGQEKILKIFKTKNIQPAIIVHRGHSYYAYKTIEKITPGAKIVFLGSCGGYNNIEAILEKAPKAHIISTKGKGTMFINDPLLKMLNDEILDKKSINWQNFWLKIEKRFENNPDFINYIPPHKNIGVLFIKAYRQLLSKNK